MYVYFYSHNQSKQRLLIGLGSMSICMCVCDTPWEKLMFDGEIILLYCLHGLIVRSSKTEGFCMLRLGAVSASLVPAQKLYMEKSSIKVVAKGK